MKISSNLVAFLENMNCTYLSGTWQQKSYHKGLSTLKKYQGKPMVLHDFFHHSAIISCITFHIWKSVDSETFNKVYRGILRFLSVHRNTRFIEGWTVLTETIVIVQNFRFWPKISGSGIPVHCKFSEQIHRFSYNVRHLLQKNLQIITRPEIDLFRGGRSPCWNCGCCPRR